MAGSKLVLKEQTMSFMIYWTKENIVKQQIQLHFLLLNSISLLRDKSYVELSMTFFQLWQTLVVSKILSFLWSGFSYFQWQSKVTIWSLWESSSMPIEQMILLALVRIKVKLDKKKIRSKSFKQLDSKSVINLNFGPPNTLENGFAYVVGKIKKMSLACTMKEKKELRKT